MIFLIVFSIVSLFRQFDAIKEFTAEKPVALKVSSVEDRDAELNQLAERLESFRQQLTDGKDTSLLLSAEDMNLAIAAYEPLKELRGTFHIDQIADGEMDISISFKINGKPRLPKKGETGWFNSDPRYLNAEIVAHPKLAKGEIALEIDSIKVPGKTVPEEFKEQMSPYRITQRYTEDAVIGPSMAKLTGVEIQGDKVLFRRKSGEKPSDNITREQVDSASSRFFKIIGIAATIFLTLVGIVLLIGIRAKKNRSESGSI